MTALGGKRFYKGSFNGNLSTRRGALANILPDDVVMISDKNFGRNENVSLFILKLRAAIEIGMLPLIESKKR